MSYVQKNLHDLRVFIWPHAEDYHCPDAAFQIVSSEVKECALRIITEKQVNIDHARAYETRKRNPGEWFLIGGDVFTMGYLFLQGMAAFSKTVANFPLTQWAINFSGVIGGVINIGVGLYSFQQCYLELNNKHYYTAFRYALDGLCLVGVGGVLTATAITLITTAVSAFVAIAAFCIAHPYLLPVLFLSMNIPILLEVRERDRRIRNGTTLADEIFASEIPVLPAFKEQNKREITEKLNHILETWTDSMGVEQALELFKYKVSEQYFPDSDRTEIEAKFRLRKKEWETAQRVRGFQMTLFNFAFIGSMVGLSARFHRSQALIEGVQNIILGFGNLIPLGMDIYWPFKRNTAVSVPAVII